jgi:serine/threonine protein kinase
MSGLTLTVSSDWVIQREDIILGDEIGRGAFGVVFKGTFHNMDVAIKRIASSVSYR